jgi:hypothetical protein
VISLCLSTVVLFRYIHIVPQTTNHKRRATQLVPPNRQPSFVASSVIELLAAGGGRRGSRSFFDRGPRCVLCVRVSFGILGASFFWLPVVKLVVHIFVYSILYLIFIK